MGLQAAEQLVTELAAGRVGNDFQPTEIQNELNIPVFLIYLFGIVIAEEEYQRWKNDKPDHDVPNPFNWAREKRFLVFQKQYFESLESSDSTKSYKLTTRMLPSKEQQAIVKRDLLAECEKLESLSNEALEALLLEEATLAQQAMTKSKRKKKKKKSKNQAVASDKNEVVAIDTGDEKMPSTTHENSATSDTERIDDNEMEKDSSSSCSIVLEPDAVNAIDSNLSKAQVKLDDQTNDRGFQVESLLETLTSPSRLELNEGSILNTAMDPSNLQQSTDDASMLTQRIRDLELQLAEANRRSEEERMAHRKALRKEKERHESLIQALQLRLYISENKVRTYEDALEKHIESVSVLNGSGCSVKKRNQEEQRVPNSPSLISKVLENTRAARNGEIWWGTKIWYHS